MTDGCAAHVSDLVHRTRPRPNQADSNLSKCSLRSGRAQFQSLTACLSRKAARVPGDSRAKQWQVAGKLFVKQLRSYYPQPLRLLIHWDSCSAEFLADHVPAVTLRPPHGLVPHASALSQSKQVPGHFCVPVAPPLTPADADDAHAPRDLRRSCVPCVLQFASGIVRNAQGLAQGFRTWLSGSSAVWWSSLWVPM